MGSVTKNDALSTSTPLEQISEAWHGPGPAAFDFRSDTISTPTLSMLRAIEQTTLMDDVFQEDPATNHFQHFIAGLTGKEAALLVMSGTMGNQVALRSLLTQPPHSILCHDHAHILTAEAGGCAVLSQAQVCGIRPSNGLYITLDDVRRNVILGTNIHSAPTRVIVIENTISGTITPLSECQAISSFARSHGIKMHLDGARIWETVSSGAGSLPDFLDCFDTAQLCFSKGLAAPIGSIIVGDAAIIDRCRWIRKSIGGGIRQAGIISSAAKVAVLEAFGRGPNGEGGRLRESHVRAKAIEKLWTDLGGKVARPVETNMVWLDLEDGDGTLATTDRLPPIDAEDLVRIGKEEGVKLLGARIVVHYQICEEALQRLARVFTRVMKERKHQVGKEESVGVKSQYGK